MYKEKIKKKISKLRSKRKVKEENKLTVTMKRLLRAFNLYWKFMCTDENHDKNKKN